MPFTVRFHVFIRVYTDKASRHLSRGILFHHDDRCVSAVAYNSGTIGNNVV